MVKLIERLDALVAKTSKNISAAQAKECASLLIALYKQSMDKIMIAQYICTLHFSVCQLFFEYAVSELQSGQIESICSAVRNNEQYKKNVSYKGTARGYIAAAVLIANQNTFGKVLLMNTISDTEKDGSLPPKAIELFNKHVIGYCNAKPLIELGESPWKDPAKRDKFRNLLEMALTPAISTAAKDSAGVPESKGGTPEKEPLTPPDTATKQNAQNEAAQYEAAKNEAVMKSSIAPPAQVAAPAAQDDKQTSLANEVELLLKTTQKANSELQTLLRTIVNTNETPSYLRRQISELEKRLAGLSEQINERDSKLVLLEKELAERDNTISRLQANNDDLTARLTKTLQLDTSANNQELITMRTDISNALKLEYQDYQDSRGKEQTNDQFEAYKASLFRIFKTLKRFNITLD